MTCPPATDTLIGSPSCILVVWPIGIWRIRTIYNSAQWYLWRIRTTCWRIRTTAGELGQLGRRIRTTIKFMFQIINNTVGR